MPDALIAHFPDRGVVAVDGPDADKLLQGLITNDMGLLARQPAIHAGLLSPQGKILFDFLVVKRADAVSDPAGLTPLARAPDKPGSDPRGQTLAPAFLLDVARDQAAGLAKRLTMYKLRAAVTVRDASGDFAVLASWGGASPPALAGAFADPRLDALGWRAILPAAAAGPAANADATRYHAHRIGLGVPEGGRDYAFGDAFPHEALFDQLHGVSFTKGCYVGQEIVSRMENRGTARKRIVPVVAARPLPAAGVEILAGEVAIGTLGSTAGNRGLALLRLDRAQEFKEKGVPLTASGIEVTIEPPPWARFKPDAAAHP